MQDELVAAARDGDLAHVRRAVEGGAKASERDKWGRVPLLEAARGGHMDVVEFLVASGADVNVSDTSGATALEKAAFRGRLHVVQGLVRLGADVNATDKSGETLLMKTAGFGHEDILKYLIDSGADVNTTGENGETALMKAAAKGGLGSVKILVECGADVSAGGDFGETALVTAGARGHLDVLKYLVGFVRVDDISRDTALANAASEGRLDVVKYLISCYTEANTTARQTAFMNATSGNHLDVVKYLVDSGASVNATDGGGETALNTAAEYGYLDVVKYLVDCGADVNSTDDSGDTALIKASMNGYLDVVKNLVDVGAEVNTRGNNGQTALMKAASNGHLDVATYLVDCGADAKISDNDGLVASAVAAQYGHLDIQRMLSQHSAKSAMLSTEIVFPTGNLISSKNAELLISPFDIKVVQATNSDNTAADFIATWLDADVALKLFVPDTATTNFHEEVALWHQLRHPNIIKLYGACDVGHNMFVCELASKGSVVDYLKACPSEIRRPWKYLHHAALGLAYLHERGIIHGDLRGSNILLGDDNQAKLASFGLSGSSSSKFDNEVTGTRGFVGSKRWQSPELLWGEKASQASDMYALGLCIVEMVTGEMPWHDKDDVWGSKLNWEPESGRLGYWPAEIAGVCRRIVTQLCSQNPSLRLTASDCVRLLEDFATNEELEVVSSQTQDMSSGTMQTNSSDSQHQKEELAELWAKIEALYTDGTAATTESFPRQWVIEDLAQIYDTIQTLTPQPTHLIEKLTSLLEDTLHFVQHSGQATLVIQLSSSRATGSSVHALRRRINTLKKQLGVHQEQNQDIQSTGADRDVSLRTQETQIFISEVSKTWLILDELETHEERAAFLAHLYAEINDHGASYSNGQRDIMQQAYDDLKNKMDASREFSANLPVWFIPWYELAQSSGGQVEIGSGGFGSVSLTKWLDSDVVVKRLESPVQVGGIDSSGWRLADSTAWSSDVKSSADNVKPDSQTEDEECRMFEREVNIWFHLSHPHVVRLFGACHVGRQPFFVCEYASNGSLDKYLLDHPDEVWKKLHEASLGLLYLHERGIVHCDLKCNNIVVGSDKKAKVTDFGLSLAASVDDDSYHTEKNRNITGAWHWLAPELLLEKSTTPTRASDVFSFGMCIIEALRVVAAAQVESEERESMPPRVPWQLLERDAVKYFVKRGKLPDRPIGCTDSQWGLIEKLCKFDPNERIQMCTVVDVLSLLAGIQEPSEQRAAVSSHIDVLAVAADTKVDIARMRNSLTVQQSRGKVYQMHELLWTRIEDIHTRFDADGKIDASKHLEVFAADAESRMRDVSTHSDSLLDFTELALQAYDYHRRLDKLMAAAFVRVANSDGSVIGTSVHDWKRKCYEILEVDAVIAAQLLHVGGQSILEADASRD